MHRVRSGLKTKRWSYPDTRSLRGIVIIPLKLRNKITLSFATLRFMNNYFLLLNSQDTKKKPSYFRRKERDHFYATEPFKHIKGMLNLLEIATGE